MRDFISTNQSDISVVLDNLLTLNNLVVAHLPGVEEVLELYPALAAGAKTTLHNNRLALAQVLQVQQTPEDCGDPTKNKEGYDTVRRQPGALSPMAPNTAARCTAPATGADAKNIRGSANIPGGDPVSVSGGNYAYPRVVTDNLKAGTPISVGTSLVQPVKIGDASWMTLVTDGLH